MGAPPDPVMRYRHWALIVLRVTESALALLGSIWLFYAATLAVTQRDLNSLFLIWSDSGSYFGWAVACLMPALILILVDRRLVRWMIPAIRSECPQCGYAFQNLTSTRCPECGYSLPMQSDELSTRQ